MLAQELEPEDELQMQGREPLVGEAQACFLSRVQCFEEASAWNPEQVMLARMGRRCAGAGSAFFFPPEKGASRSRQV